MQTYFSEGRTSGTNFYDDSFPGLLHIVVSKETGPQSYNNKELNVANNK